jgi:IS605 OrfB family transposase
MAATSILTVRLQVKPIGDKETQNDIYQRLRELNREVFRAANLTMSHLHFLESFENQFLQRDKMLENEILKLKQDKKKANKEKNEQEGTRLDELRQQQSLLRKEAQEKVKVFLEGKSRDNAAYMFLQSEFPLLSSYVRGNIAKTVTDKFKNDWKDIKAGTKSISNFKKDIPIPIDFKLLAYLEKGEKRIFLKIQDDKIIWEIMPFEMNFEVITGNWRKKKGVRYLEEDKNKESILQKVMSFEYKVGNSQLQLKDDKLFLLMVCKVPKKEHTLDPNIAIGVDLGIRTPACVASNDGVARFSIGSAQDFNKVRQRFYEHRKRLQKNLKQTVAGGKGREKAVKALEKLKSAERNFVRTYNHTLSKKIVDFALKHRASKIKMELLEGYGRDENGFIEQGKFVLRYWSYYELQTMIAQKASESGVEVWKIDPYHTSQRCHACKQRGERKSAIFVCTNPDCKAQYQKKQNADHNAAINIAQSENRVNKKEDCYYHIKKDAKKKEDK